ncbi:unnamed protein product [Parnassius mnemosyne]|uniref:Uncharacterized protein n=1 Tax=Parnassius mnemosyne TaxID=213953 RepID=A0AAV1M974_9NEOP
MDCCNYGEFRHAHGQYTGAAWDGYGYALPYAPYAHGYYAPHAQDPYGRYYRYDYPTPHSHHNEHAMPMDYGAYATKESRGRRALSRRDQRAHTPAHHLPLPHTPPSECGMTGRGASFCESQMWPHYQMGFLGGGGWSGANAVGGAWATRGMSSREQMRYMASDYRMIKGPHVHHQNSLCPPDGRSTPYPVYEDVPYVGDNGRQSGIVEFSARNVTQSEEVRPVRERMFSEPRRTPPEEKRPPIVPLPAFQQAFGSTEIGKFAEAFSRAEVAHEVEDISNENFVFETFQEWDSAPDAQWSSQPAAREIKCEENCRE